MHASIHVSAHTSKPRSSGDVLFTRRLRFARLLMFSSKNDNCTVSDFICRVKAPSEQPIKELPFKVPLAPL